MPNGGYVLAVALAGVRAAVKHPHPMTVTAHYLGPGRHGDVDVEVDVLKEGRSMSTATVRLVQDGRVRLTALASFGDLDAQSGPTLVLAQPPDLPPPGACAGPEDRPFPAGFPAIPAIMQRVEFRASPASVERLRDRAGPPLLEGWMRLRDGRPLDPQCLPLLCDAAPPALFAALETGWVPTLELTVHVRGIPAPGWLRAAFSTQVIVDGIFEEDCQLWDETGRLVAMSRQLARILSPPA